MTIVVTIMSMYMVRMKEHRICPRSDLGQRRNFMKKYLFVISSLAGLFFSGISLAAYNPREYQCIDWATTQLQKLGCSKISNSGPVSNAIRDLYNKEGCRLNGTTTVDPKTGAKLDQNKSELCIAEYTPDSVLKNGGRFRTPKESINSHLRNKDLSGCEYDDNIKGEKDASVVTAGILTKIESGECATLGNPAVNSVSTVTTPVKPVVAVDENQNDILQKVADEEENLNGEPNAYYGVIEGDYRGKNIKVVVSATWEGAKKDENGKTIYKFRYSTDGYHFYNRLTDAIAPSFFQRIYRSIFSRTPSVQDFENNTTEEYVNRLFGGKVVDNTTINRQHIQQVAKLYIEDRRAGKTPEQIFSNDSEFLLSATPLLPSAYKIEGNDADELERLRYRGHRSDLERLYNQIDLLQNLKQK